MDGLTSEFYKSFSKELAPFLLNLFSQSIDLEKLPPTFTQGWITLIPKPKKDTSFLDNWRPICLLNIDYKILAFIFSVRIKKTLDLIIDDTQSGFMRNRHISNNISLVLDLIDYPHLYSDKSFIRDRAPMVQRTLLNLLRLLLGTEHQWYEDPIVSVLYIIRDRASMVRGPYCICVVY